MLLLQRVINRYQFTPHWKPSAPLPAVAPLGGGGSFYRQADLKAVPRSPFHVNLLRDIHIP